MAEVVLTLTAKDETGTVFDKAVGNYERVKAAATSAMDKISNAASYMGNTIITVYDAAHKHFNALPEVLTAGMIGAVGNIVVQMGILPGVIGSTAAKIFSGGGAISTGMTTASTSMIASLGIQMSSAVEKTVQTISAAAGGAILSMMSMIGVLAISALFFAAVKATLEWTESVAALGKQLQMSSEAASAYKVILTEQRVSTESFSSANTTLINTLNNNETAISDMGIATRNASGELRSTAELLPEVNTKLLGMKDRTTQNAKALEIYGSKWNDLTGVMKINIASMADATNQAKGLGLIVGQNNVTAAEKYKTALATLELVTKSLMISTGQNLLPVFAEFYKILGDIATVVVPLTGSALNFLGGIIKEIGLHVGLAIISVHAFGSALYDVATGDFAAAKRGLTDYIEELKIFSKQQEAILGGKSDPTKALPQDARATEAQSTAIARTMQLELQALRQQNSDKAALYKADSAIQLTIINGTYAAGLMTTTEYFNAVSKQSEATALAEIKSAQDYLAAVKVVVQKTGELKGAASDEYKAALNAEAQAQQTVSMAQLALGKIMVEDSIKITEALKTRQNEYSKLSIQLLSDTGQYVAAEQKKQEMDQRSTEYLLLKKEALSGISAAVQALADLERSASLASITSTQKEDAALRQYADNYRSIQDKIAAANGKNSEVIQAESSIQDALNQKKEYENKLVIAKQTGILADYSYAVKMIAAWDTHITQLTTALDLTRRKANLDAQGNADQIIINDLIAKGLNQEAFWLQKKIDLRNLAAKAAADQLSFDKQIISALNDQNSELAESLILAKQITAEQNMAAGYAIRDRQLSSAAPQPTSSVTQSSGFTNANAFPSSLGSPFLGGFATGTNYIPSDGYAFLHKGEAVIPKQYNPAAGGQNSASSITIQGGITISLPNAKMTEREADEAARMIYSRIKQFDKRYA